MDLIVTLAGFFTIASANHCYVSDGCDETKSDNGNVKKESHLTQSVDARTVISGCGSPDMKIVQGLPLLSNYTQLINLKVLTKRSLEDSVNFPQI